MSSPWSERVQDAQVSQEERAYRAMTPTSAQLFADARRYLPGGDSRSPLHHPPYPVTLAEGHGAHVVDVDGNELLDLTGNHTALVHGYGHPQVLAAVRNQLASGTCFPGPTTAQGRLARQLTERIPSMERIRFTNSGTEAVMLAVRAARAHTGRAVIAKAEGGYHGTWDDVLVSASAATDTREPGAVAGSAGLAPGVPDRVIVLPFHDVEAAAALLERQGRQVAAVVVEPVQASAGMIPAAPEYLRMLREVTARHGTLLIFDEVVSFRVAYGGAQQHFDVRPDLTCLGKAIGGGFPLGAFGGRADVMAAFDPTRPEGPRIPHPGSLNANPVSLVAGSVTLDLLTPEAMARLNRLGDDARARIREVLCANAVQAQVTGLGSLFGIHLTDRRVNCSRDAASADRERGHRLHLGLFTEGVLLDPRGVGCLSTAIAEPDVDVLAGALDRVTHGRPDAPPPSPVVPGRPRGGAAAP